MKATLRRSGRHMVTMTTKHHLTGRDFAVMLVRFCSSGYGFGMGQQLTRAQLENTARRVLAGRGDDAFEDPDWRENIYDDDERAATCAWAVAQVQRLIPEMASDPELTALLLDSV